jgi:polyisoprenoid-binding protein YceI
MRWFPLIALAVACAPDPGEGKPKAEVVAVPPAPPSAAPAAAPAHAGLTVPAITAAKVLKVDRSKSSLDAVGAKITATHPIKIHTFEGAIGLDGDNVSAVAFAADVASLESDNERLTQHLKKEDFLDVARFPYATFASTEVKPGGEGGTHTVTGDLTIRGKTLRVSFPATLKVGASDVTASTEFVVNRQDFGVTYPGKPDDLVKDNVVLKVAFVAPRA